jgi:hypothetical protein
MDSGAAAVGLLRSGQPGNSVSMERLSDRPPSLAPVDRGHNAKLRQKCRWPQKARFGGREEATRRGRCQIPSRCPD